MRIHKPLGVLGALLAALALSSCGGGVGACQSSAVEFSFGLRVYCYSEWDEADCDINNDENVNGASWEFHSGQTCEDRGLTDGSNPWP